MNHRIHDVLAALALPAVIALGGCATEEPKSPDRGLTEPFHPPTPPDLGRGPGTLEVEGLYSMYVMESVRELCAGPDPFFAFDSSKATGGDQPTMRVLVDCMISGPLRGKRIRLIGHTDPRGTDAHNDDLGLERAQRVKTFLVGNGVDQDRIETASMGAEGAAQAPKDWGRDRRVQIQLVP
ncbi:MAG: OmpA family protein [Polyangiaceae bacterium]|jgi:peptidoglycan-associated lipoprotein